MEGLGDLYDMEGMSGIGYWFNPKSGQHHTIAWEQADSIEGAYEDHADVVFEHPEWFGMTAEELADAEDGDVARYGAIGKGWVRIGFNDYSGLRMDARNPAEAYRAFKWFSAHHQNISSITIDIVTKIGFTGYGIKGKDVAEYAASGRLQPAWRGTEHKWNA